MKISKHATSRCQQRGIKSQDIKYILALGTETNKIEGATEYTITNRDAKLLIQKIDKLVGKKIIIGDNDTIITAYQMR